MAQKKITDLQLRSAVIDTLNFPSDDTIQSYRVTALQIFNYIYAKEFAAATISAAGTTLTSANRIVLLNPTSASFTQNLPAVGSLDVGYKCFFKNIATNGNIATLDGATTELIDNALTLDLGSDPVMEGVWLYNSGTKWLIF